MELLTTILGHNSELEVIKLLLENDKAEKLNVALVEFKKTAPAIEKLAQGHNLIGESFDYAKLEEIQDLIDPVLLANNLTYSFEQETQGERVKVTCVITHVAGGSKSVSMSSAKHNDDKLTKEQQTAVTTSYLKRYTLTNVLGLVIKGQDSDGCAKASIDPLGLGKKPHYRTPREATEALKQAVEKTEKKPRGLFNINADEITVEPAPRLPVYEMTPAPEIPIIEDEELDAIVDSLDNKWQKEEAQIWQITKSVSLDDFSMLPLIAEMVDVMDVNSLDGVTVVTIEATESAALQIQNEHDVELKGIQLDVYERM